MVQRVGWPVPYYLQLLFNTVYEQVENKIQAVDQQAVDKAFDTLLAPAHKAYFDYWRQRLSDELEQPDSAYAIRLLNSICQDKSGVSRQTLQQVLSKVISDPEQKDEKLRYLLDVLENDGYLVVIEQRYCFRLALLREYWQQRVAF